VDVPDTAPPAATGRKILEQLEGLVLDNGWKIGRLLPKEEGQTGGHFSRGYECTSTTGQQAFFKAIDLFEALSDPGNVLAALNALADGALCEEELLKVCRKMDRVVSALAFGTIRTFRGEVLQIPVPYIIFERADGNVRHVVRASARPSQEWILRTLHHVTTGMMQLHRARIAHQDLKLSNVLHFKDRTVVKISDLGRSVRQGRAVWYDRYDWPGDNAYAPPEVAYGFAQNEFNAQRLASDMYLLGGFACALLTAVPINAILYTALPIDFRPPLFKGNYAGTFEHVLPHLQEAFDHVIQTVESHIPATAPHREQMLGFIRQWCEPDPRHRGHPLTRARNARGGNIYDLERYASALPNLTIRAAVFDRASRHSSSI
jgi:eukaryotic-like serine/threonine-protein kinase